MLGRIATFRILAGVVLLACLLHPDAFAQKKGKAKKGKSPKTSGKAAQAEKLIREGDDLYKRGFYTRQTAPAEKKYLEASRLQNPPSYDLCVKLAHVEENLGKYEEASKWYNTATDLDPNRRDTTWFDLGSTLKQLGRYPESTRAFEQFLTLHKRADYLNRQATQEIESNKTAEEIASQPATYTVKKLSIDTKGDEEYPAIKTVGNTRYLIFTTQRKGNLGKAVPGLDQFSDLWQAKMTNDSVFGGAENMGKAINTPSSDGSATLSPDGNTMYYTICGQGKVSKTWGCSIYQSTYDPDKKVWKHFELVEGINGTREVEVNSKGRKAKVPTYDAQPCLTPDGNTLYFVSDRPGGAGATDIWYSVKAGNKWGQPVNAGKTINSEFDEIKPYLTPDGQALIFASKGQKGLGGYDLYQAKGSQANWDAVTNMGNPLNSSYDDLGLLWVIQDSLGYVTSNRPEGPGKDDIYLVRKIPNVDDQLEITVQGRVRDKKTKQSIPFATVTLYLTEDNALTPLDTFKTDQSGQYKFVLKRSKDYKLVGNAPEYLANEVFVSTKNITKTTQLEADIDIFLERIEVNKPIVLQNIYYDFDKADLRSESVTELRNVVKIMNENPGITIQIGSHTDTNGSEKYNIGLSQRRAKSVVGFLNKNGVPAKRINSFGYGESQPLIYPEMSDADEQANRRTEFRIRTLDFTADSAPQK